MTPPRYVVRNLRPTDFQRVIDICHEVYPTSTPWTVPQLESHLKVFPEGQLVVCERRDDRLIGMASSLIILWDDYEQLASWRDFTDGGFFTNHDPEDGKTLYGAEIFIHPDYQGKGAGKKLYQARFDLCRSLNLKRIRAGARLRGYHRYADKMSAEEYVRKVSKGTLSDPTLSFQIKQGFQVFGVVPGYLRQDPDSRGFAALIEWVNPDYQESNT